jgi:hypothetical protein
MLYRVDLSVCSTRWGVKEYQRTRWSAFAGFARPKWHFQLIVSDGLKFLRGDAMAKATATATASARSKRTSSSQGVRAKLLGISATGPIYQVPTNFAVISVDSALAWYQELATKAADPKRRTVVSSLAARVDKDSATSAWLIQTTKTALSLLRLSPRERLRFLREVLTYTRMHGAFGNETILAAAINSAWPWLDTPTLTAVLGIAHRSLDQSDFTDKSCCVVVDPSTRTFTLLDAGQFKTASPMDWLDWHKLNGRPDWQVDGDRWRLGPVADPFGFEPTDAGLDRLGLNQGSYTPGDFQGPGGYRGPGQGSGGWGTGIPQGFGNEGSYTPGDFQGPGGYRGPGLGSGGYDWTNVSRGGFGALGVQSPGMSGGPLGFGAFPGLGGASDPTNDAAIIIGGVLAVAGGVAATVGGGFILAGRTTQAAGETTLQPEGVVAGLGMQFQGVIIAGAGALVGGFGAWLVSAGNRGNTKEDAAAAAAAPGQPAPGPGQPAPTPAPAPQPAPAPKPPPTPETPVVVIEIDEKDDKPKFEPHTGDLYPDPDGGGIVDPTKIWEGEGGVGPASIWEGEGGVGPASIWEENGGGGTPATTGAEITAPTLAGPGLRAGVVQISRNVFAF